MTWEDTIKKAPVKDNMPPMFRLLREARDSGHDTQEGLDYQLNRMNSGAKRMPDDTLSISELERRSDIIYKATRDIQKIIDDLMKLAHNTLE